MRNAMRVAENTAALKEVDILIDLPGGRRLHMLDSGPYANQLHTHVLDFTEGWYAPGWSEPQDYADSEFTDPIPIAPPIGGGGGDAETRWRDHLGNPVILRDHLARPVQLMLGAA